MVTKAKMILLTVTSMSTASLSIIGSVAIMTMLLRSERKLNSTYRRLLFGMSFMDIIFSSSIATGSFASPKGTAVIWSPLGNTATCSVQGWALYSGNIGLTFYNCSLCLYYTLSIAKNVKTEKMVKIERFFHALPAIWILSTTIFLFSTQSFNNFGVSCMIASYPKGCDSNPDVECTRGLNAKFYRLILHVIPVMLIFIIICGAMVVLCRSIRDQERKMKSYDVNLANSTLPESIVALRRNSAGVDGRGGISLRGESSSPRRKNSLGVRLRKEAFKQALWHVIAYFVSYVFAVIFQIIAFAGTMNFVAWYLQQLTTPAQGFFNFIVFLRPRVVSARASHPELSLFQAVQFIFRNNGDESNRHVLACQELSLPPERRQSGRYTSREWHLKTRTEELKALEEETKKAEERIIGIEQQEEEVFVREDSSPLFAEN